ncbi:MAG: tRNA 2-selenouridine(34) synthase MnmH [Bacteroidia bacterium]|nr:tRNA 2-selenouridine(34) synthase MnmH [Bacteroidia bacterium]
MLKQITFIDFFNRSENAILLDSRSEGEYLQGHIPGAVSFPILNNEERKLVGTCYKQKGHQPAVILGYELVGTQFKRFVEEAYAKFPVGPVYIHCWRGGLRSQIMGNLLSSAGYQVFLLKGGYKVYREAVLDKLAVQFEFKVLGGFTGSGKTIILNQMIEKGCQVLDLEALANHRGSAFGNIGLPAQVSQEQYENDIYTKLISFDLEKPVWVEDESRLIGKFQIPVKVHEGIRNSVVYFLDYSFETRCKNILELYGKFNINDLIGSTERIKKKLGDQRTREAIAFLQQGNYDGWIEIVLEYYDKLYQFGLEKRDPEKIIKIKLSGKELLAYLTNL